MDNAHDSFCRDLVESCRHDLTLGVFQFGYTVLDICKSSFVISLSPCGRLLYKALINGFIQHWLQIVADTSATMVKKTGCGYP